MWGEGWEIRTGGSSKVWEDEGGMVEEVGAVAEK
jgi:hypothetical protein